MLLFRQLPRHGAKRKKTEQKKQKEKTTKMSFTNPINCGLVMRGKPLFRPSMRSDVINGFFDTVAGPNLLNQLNPAAKRSKVEAAQIYNKLEFEQSDAFS